MTKAKSIRYAHTNIIADDWQRLRDFYVEVLECEAVGALRQNRGPDFDALTGLTGGSIQGRHLRLPGHGDNGPTLEIFQSSANESRLPASLFRPGFAHLAFEVPDVEQKREQILKWGGSDYGKLVTIDIPGEGRLTLVYMKDPEGNIIELQRWHAPGSDKP